MAQLPQGFSRLPSGAIRWRVSVGGRKASGTAPTLAQARAARAQASIDLGDTPTAARMAVAELVDMWLAEVKHTGNTATRRDNALATIPDAFMRRQLHDVTPPVVAALWRQMAAGGVGAHTIDKARNALSAAFRLGYEYGLATGNPIRAAAYSPPPAAEITPPTVEQVRSILAAFEHRPALAAYLRVMATVGTRPGELCALRWDNFDRARNVIRVTESVGRDRALTQGKNKRAGWRDLHLDLPTATRLARLDRVLGCEWVFHFNAEPWRPEYPSLEFRRACSRLGIEGVRLYDCRHFAATQAIAGGRSVTEVAQMLGDRTDTVLRVYAHWIDGPTSAGQTVARALDGA